MSPVYARLSGAALAWAACSGEPPPGDRVVPAEPPAAYPHATAMTDCAPWDGIATSVFLSAEPRIEGAPPGSEVPRPHLWISVYEPRAALAGREFSFDHERLASAALCTDEGGCARASRGWVRFSETSPEGTLVGTFELDRFEPGRLAEGVSRQTGGFRAEWHERPILCG